MPWMSSAAVALLSWSSVGVNNCMGGGAFKKDDVDVAETLSIATVLAATVLRVQKFTNRNSVHNHSLNFFRHSCSCCES